MRDWPPCPPIQWDGGRRSRPGVNPFISALTVARCPATFPGVWPQLRDTLSTSRSVGRGTGAFIYLPPFSENRPIFCSFPFAKIQPVFLPEQTGRKKHRTPFPPSATPAGITHYTFVPKVVCQMGTLWKPSFCRSAATLRNFACAPRPPKLQKGSALPPGNPAVMRSLFAAPSVRSRGTFVIAFAGQSQIR